jgi:hypothetical protein
VLHVVHVAAVCCLLLDVFVALLMFVEPAGGLLGSDKSVIAQGAVAAFALAINACFIITCAVLIVVCFFKKFRRTSAKLRRVLAS